MINFSTFKETISNSNVASWHDYLLKAVESRYRQYTHGELDQWNQLVASLPAIKTSETELSHSITIKTNDTLEQAKILELKQKLMQLHPWRKGPFQLFDIDLNTEWRSDWKWDRIKPHLADLSQRTVLDVGCGNGYHCLRMAGENARFVLGIDPSQKFLAQFSVIQHYLQQRNAHLLPLGIEDMPDSMGENSFDTVFCMGVLYHQKSPIHLIQKLHGLLRKGGELVLETLIVDGDQTTVLVPSGRYAQMRNVWFLPSTDALELWLAKCGFRNIRTIEVNQTSTQEQRATDWMTFHSLANYLDPADNNKTIEGYPAPKRATLLANK
jgi:tRNA (mo5U34)-methyltransferase